MKIFISIILCALMAWAVSHFEFSDSVEEVDGTRYISGEIQSTECEYKGRKNTAYYDFTLTDGREIMVRAYGKCSGALPYFQGRQLYGYFIGANPMQVKVGDDILVSFSRGKFEHNLLYGAMFLMFSLFLWMLNFPETRKKLVKKLRVHVLGKKE